MKASDEDESRAVRTAKTFEQRLLRIPIERIEAAVETLCGKVEGYGPGAAVVLSELWERK